MKPNFQDESQLYANCLSYILIIYRKFFAFQCLSRGIRIAFPFKEGLKMGSSLANKLGIFCFKFSFQIFKSQYIFLDDMMCVGFQLLYELSQLSLRYDKRFPFNISKFYSNTSRQPTISFLIL